MPIYNLLNSEVLMLESKDPIEKAIELFRTQNIHAAPVMEDGKLSGIITLVSVYQFLSRPGHYTSCPVDWIMQRPPVWVPSDVSLALVAKTMRDSHVFTLPVMDGDVIIGLISVEKLLETVMAETQEN